MRKIIETIVEEEYLIISETAKETLYNLINETEDVINRSENTFLESSEFLKANEKLEHLIAINSVLNQALIIGESLKNKRLIDWSLIY